MAIMDPLAEAPTPAAAPVPRAPSVDPRYDIDNKDTAQKILSRIRDKHALWSKGGREQVCRNAFRNILFKRGHQWITYHRGRGAWLPIGTKYTGPRPVSNRFSATMNAFTSTIARIEPKLLYRPGTEEAEDRATAEVASRAIEICEGESNLRSQRQILAEWVGYTGGAWLESGYDPSPEHGMRFVPHDECVCGWQGALNGSQGTCPECGGPTMPAVDPLGEPIGEQQPIGKMFTEVCTVFEMYFDASEPDWTRIREYIRKKSLPDKETAVRRWKARAEGVSADLGPLPLDTYQDQLATLAGYQPEQGPGAGLLPTRSGPQGRVSEMYYWSMPTDDYPEGVLAVVLGSSTLVYLGPLPYTMDGRPFLPTVYFPIDPVPGSLYSKTPADDLALIAVKRNQLDANILMTMNRMAWPIWMVPEGANVSQFSGEPGQILKWNPLGPANAKPERIQGAGLPNGAITWMQYMDTDFEELSAAYAGTKGDRQAGVSAGIALQMIEDRKNQRFGPMYILWELAHAQWATQQLAIFRQFVTEPRLRKMQGRGSQWRIEKFLGADLTGKIDIIAEAGSGAPKSSLVTRAELEQLAANRIIDISDPDVKLKWLDEWGYSNWLPAMKADSEEAAQQIEDFEALAADPQMDQALGMLLAQQQQAYQEAMMQAQGPTMAPDGSMAPPAPPAPPTYSTIVPIAAQRGIALPPVLRGIDGHAIFARELAAWIKGSARRTLPVSIRTVVEMKHAEHAQFAQQEAMQAMQQQAGAQPTSGFLSNPGGMQGPEPPSRMGGEFAEMQQAAQ